MKRLLLASALIVLTALPALATERYFSVSSGVWLPHSTSTIGLSNQSIITSYSPGWSLGAAYGIALDSGLRIENELTYRQAEAKGSNTDQWTLGLLVNFWWEGRNSTPITPYFVGGFGFGRGRIASPGIVDESGHGIAYQAGGGIDYRLYSSLDLDFGYRYFGIKDTSSGNGVGSFNPEGSSWTVGVRKKF